QRQTIHAMLHKGPPGCAPRAAAQGDHASPRAHPRMRGNRSRHADTAPRRTSDWMTRWLPTNPKTDSPDYRAGPGSQEDKTRQRPAGLGLGVWSATLTALSTLPRTSIGSK